MKITILFNRLSDNPLPDELDVLDQVRIVSESLISLGHTVDEQPFDLNLEAVKQALLQSSPDAVFNLVESVDQKGSLIHLAPALLETLRIPYSGCPADAVFATSNKLIAKKMLRASQLPTPDWFRSGDSHQDGGDRRISGKWIVKSVWEHASSGMDETSVIEVHTAEDIGAAIDARKRQYGGDWFAEKYIDGREFNIALLAGQSGMEVMCPAEILFDDFDVQKPRIVDYRAKWETESFEYQHTKRSFTFPDADSGLLAKLAELSGKCWKEFQLRGYARVDFRVDSTGYPWILEINANPCLSDDAGFVAAVRETGYSFTEAVRRILEDSSF